MCKHFIGISLLASIYHHCFHELSPFVDNQPSSFSPCRLCLIGGAYGTSCLFHLIGKIGCIIIMLVTPTC